MLTCSLFLVIIAATTPGYSLFVNLSADHDIACSGNDTVSYTCIASTLEVQWIAEPFITTTGPNSVFFSNILSSVGAIISRTGILVEHVSFDPFLTRLTINASVINSSVNVTCSTSGLTSERASTLQYSLDNGSSVESVSGVKVTPIANDLTILVEFVPSPSPGITNYIINCTDNSCRQTEIGAMEDDAVVEASSGSAHTVCVYAVNRCGRESQMSCSDETTFSVSSAYSFTISSTAFYGVVGLYNIQFLLRQLGDWILSFQPNSSVPMPRSQGSGLLAGITIGVFVLVIILAALLVGVVFLIRIMTAKKRNLNVKINSNLDQMEDCPAYAPSSILPSSPAISAQPYPWNQPASPLRLLPAPPGLSAHELHSSNEYEYITPEDVTRTSTVSLAYNQLFDEKESKLDLEKEEEDTTMQEVEEDSYKSDHADNNSDQ